MSAGGMGGQAQQMGGGKGGMGMQQGPAAGGKGGMGMNRGPGGNAQNNPGGMGGPRPFGPGPFNPFGQQGPGPMTWGGRPAVMSNDNGYGNFGGGGNISLDKGWGMGGGGGNFTPPTPQPQEPVGGYIGGQPAQFHYQAQALNKPQPQTNASGLPAGGLLARLYGG